MGIEKINERILEEAQDEKNAILEEANARALDIKARSDQKAEEVRRALREKFRKIGEEEERKILSISQLELRKSLLAEKQALIDEVFEKSKEKLQKLPSETYQKLILQMLVRSAVTGDEEILISKADRGKITPELVTMANNNLKKSGAKGNLKLSDETRTMIGGFVLKSKDFEINNTFDALIKGQREELETKIAKILFEE